MSIEDRRFYQHIGVDPIGILSAVAGKIIHPGAPMRGASTLTQQLVKLSVFSTAASDQTLKRKAQEAWLSLKVERNFTKNEILTFYINKVYMGNGVYGMKTAADYYYGVGLDKLNISQTAVLAGIPQQPNNFDPYTHPDWLKDRRDEVLLAEYENGKIKKDEYDKAKAADVMDGIITEHSSSDNVSQRGLIVDAYVQSTLAEAKKLGYDPQKDNLKIYTSMNYKIQKQLYSVVNGDTGIYIPDGLQAAATMTDPNNGRVIAQIGGRQLDTVFGLNRATQTTRSSGSTIKPIADYGPAIEYLNWPTYRIVADTPYKYPGTNIEVHNFDNKYKGYMTMRNALAQSRNIPAIRTLLEVGVKNSASFLNKLGFDIQYKDMVASDAVGINMSTEQGASAFNAIANGGTYYAPTRIQRIVTGDGRSQTFDSAEGKTAMKDTTSFELISMMKDVVATGGTAPGAKIPNVYMAGKSGTVGYDSKVGQPNGAISDEWFIGFTKAYTLAIWTGYDEPNKPGNYIRESGISTPDSIFKQVMGYAMEDKDNLNWKVPSGISAVTKGGETEYEITGADWSNGDNPDYAYNPDVDVATPSTTESSSSSNENSSSNPITVTPGSGANTGGVTVTEPGGT